MTARAVAFVAGCCLVLLPPREASACSCGDPGPPCASMFASTVFVGRAAKTTPPLRKVVTTFEVLETLHSPSPLGTTVDVRHSSDLACGGINFEAGATYVVYATDAGAALATTGCGRTHALQEKDEDVGFAHAAQRGEVRGRIVGVMSAVPGHEGVTLGGLVVQLGDGGAAVTTPDGGFVIEAPAGTHRLELVSDSVVAWSDRALTVSLPHPAACATPIVDVGWNGRLVGRVVTAEGAPVAGVEVAALERRANELVRRASTRTGADGTFELGRLAPVPHVLTTSGTTASAADATTYAPANGGRLTGLELVVPPPPVATVRVVVKRRGVAVQGARVTVTPIGKGPVTANVTDVAGAVEVQARVGDVVDVRACVGETACATAQQRVERKVTVRLALPK